MSAMRKKRMDTSQPIIGTDAEKTRKSIKLMMLKQFVQPEAVVKVRPIIKNKVLYHIALSSSSNGKLPGKS